MSEIDKAVEILEDNIHVIFSVTEWAEAVGYKSTKNFYRHIRKQYQETPNKIIIETKLLYIKNIIQTFSSEKFLYIALKANFNDDHHLRQFVFTHTGKSLTEFKKDALSE